MHRLEELIKKLCPNGVEYKKLEKITKSVNIGINPRKFFKLNPDDATGFYVTVRELNGLNGVIQTEKTDLINDDAIKTIQARANIENGDILFSNTGTVGKMALVNYETLNWGVNEGIFVIKPNNEIVNSKYLYYYLDSNLAYADYSKMFTGSTMKHITQKALLSVSIPVPPLEVQHEIVNILDTFEEHIECLKKELELRENSYETIMHSLLRKGNFKKFDCLENYCRFEKGKTPIQKNTPGSYPLVATTEHLQTSDNYQFDCEAVCLPLISARGHGVASITRIYYQSGKFALGNILCAIIPKDNQIKAEFLRNYLFYHKDTLLVPLMRGGANVSLTIDSLKKVQIPIPSIEEQQGIIEKLRIFQEILSKEKGIPAEIEKRQQQYEYYREKLLSFKEVEEDE